MSKILTIILKILFGLITSFLGRIAAEYFMEKAPAIANHMVNWAVSLLPPEQRDRRREEWLFHIQDTDGKVAKIVEAAGFIWAGVAIRAILMARTARTSIGMGFNSGFAQLRPVHYCFGLLMTVLVVSSHLLADPPPFDGRNRPVPVRLFATEQAGCALWPGYLMALERDRGIRTEIRSSCQASSPGSSYTVLGANEVALVLVAEPDIRGGGIREMRLKEGERKFLLLVDHTGVNLPHLMSHLLTGYASRPRFAAAAYAVELILIDSYMLFGVYFRVVIGMGIALACVFLATLAGPDFEPITIFRDGAFNRN